MSDIVNSSPPRPDDGARADRIANQFLDRELVAEATQPTRDDADTTDADATTDESSRWSAEEKRRVADLLLLDALLASGQPSRKRAVQQAMDATLVRLRNESMPDRRVASREVDRGSTRFGARRRWMLSLVGGATVAVLALIAWRFDRSRQAYAMVDRIENRAMEQIDRVYRVSIEPGVPLAPRREAKFFVRGGERFVFDDPGPLGVRLRFGGDGTTRWHLTPAGTVFLPNRLSATLESSLNEKSREAGSLPADAPYLRLDTLLARLKDRYELRIDAREKIAAASVSANVACDRLSALRTDSTPSGLMWPESVEIWSAVESGVIQRLELRWSAGSLPVGPRSLVFELISERQLDDSFYTAEFQARGDKELTP